jgi:vacuolar-type H+-ATPase subunit E/Vma4
MPLEALEQEILANARSESSAIMQDAKKKSDAILRDAELKRRGEAARAEFEVNAEIERVETEHRSGDAMRKDAIISKAAESVVERIMPAVRKAVLPMLRAESGKIFANAIKFASSIDVQENLVIEVNPEDARLLKGVKSKAEYRKMDGGIVIYSSDRKIRLDATVSNLFDRSAEDVKGIIKEELFGITHKEPKKARKLGAHAPNPKRKPKQKRGKKTTGKRR